MVWHGRTPLLLRMTNMRYARGQKNRVCFQTVTVIGTLTRYLGLSRVTQHGHSPTNFALRPSGSFWLSHWSDLRHPHRLGHAVENYNTLAAAARRQSMKRAPSFAARRRQR